MSFPNMPPRAVTEPIRDFFGLANFSDQELAVAFQALKAGTEAAGAVDAMAGELLARLLTVVGWEGVSRGVIEVLPSAEDVDEALKTIN